MNNQIRKYLKIIYIGITLMLMLTINSNELRAQDVNMLHQLNSLKAGENVNSIYCYRNVFRINSKSKKKKLQTFAVNIFDFEHKQNIHPINNPLFGGGRTNTIFLGLAYKFSSYFKISSHNGAILIYAENSPVRFLDILYFDPILSDKWKSGKNTITLSLRLRNVLYLTPVNKHDFREKIELKYSMFKSRLDLVIGNEINLNFWPGSKFNSNDLYAGINVNILQTFTIYGLFNFESSSSGNYLNSFIGTRFKHKFY